MNILERFCLYVSENKLFTKEDRLLVAVSGGKDSMFLLWSLYNAGFKIEVAHCNFQLRGEESDADEELVRTFTEKYKIPFHKNSFDTQKYAQENRVSIQMAARDLRYAWFEQLSRDLKLDYILVAQHKNDHVETVLLNLVRGTGLLGLQGILPKRAGSKIVRPLLFLTSAEIVNLTKEHNIPYRDDSSNFSNKYARNKIRLDIVPEFEKLADDFIKIMDDNITRFQEANNVLKELIDDLRKKIFVSVDNKIRINKIALAEHSLARWYFLFEPYNFSKQVLQDLNRSMNKESGKFFYSSTHELLLDRQELILIESASSPEEILFNEQSHTIQFAKKIFELSIDDNMSIDKNTDIAKIDYHKLIFPLKMRTWQEGDYFQPLGMVGRKKLSDLFIQKKINLIDKNNVPILVNGNEEIIWVAGIQLDEKYKITENTQKVLKLVITK